MDLTVISENGISSGTVSGLISGLLVAFALGILDKTSKPRLELQRINDETALLRNNGFRTVAFGDTFALEKGNDLLYPKDGFRGRLSEMRCEGRNEIVVGCGIQLGESLSITYKPLWWSEIFPNRYWRYIQNQTAQADVMTVLERTNRPWFTADGACSRFKKYSSAEYSKPVRLRGWRMTHLPLKPL